MSSLKGLLRTLLGLDANGVLYAVGIDEDGYIRVALPGQTGSGSKQNPKGKLISPVGITPTGLLKNFQVDANGNIIITLSGGDANQIVKSDGTDAEWDDLADVIKAAILTTAGDIMIVNVGGTVTRLAKPAVGQILGESSQIPAWIAKPTGGYTEGARAYNDANLSIPNTTWTYLTLNSEKWDTDTIHDLVTNNGRLTCKTAGKYDIKMHVSWAQNATGRRIGRITLNRTTDILNHEITGASVVPSHVVPTTYELAVNDYIEIRVYQSSGAALNVLVSGEDSPHFMMQRIG